MSFQVVQTFTLLTIASQPLSTVDLSQGSMYTYPEHVERRQQRVQLFRPGLLLHDVFNQKVQTYACKRTYGSMESIKECLPPRKAYPLIGRTKTLIGELVRRVEMELGFERRSKSLRER